MGWIDTENTFLVDPFESNTLGDYTQGGGAQTWAVSGGRMTGTTSGGSGLQATLHRTGFSAADTGIMIATSQQHDGGLILRRQDDNNYYLCTLSDDSGVNPTANIRIFKKVSGAYTQLGSSVNIGWTRGTVKAFKFTAKGTALKMFMDEVEQISVTDSAISAAGAVGMRSNATGSVQDQFDYFLWNLRP